MHDILTWTMAFTLIGAMIYLSRTGAPVPDAFNKVLIILVTGISGGEILLPLLIKHLGI